MRNPNLTTMESVMEFEKFDANDVETERENKIDKMGLSIANKSLSISGGQEEMNQETTPFMMNYKDHKDISANIQSTEGHSTSQIKAESQSGMYAESLAKMRMVTSVLHSNYNKSADEEQTEFDLYGSTVEDQIPCWPFEKKSCLWKVLDSIEEISIMKKPPHFRPSEDCSKLLREGMDLGFFWTYKKLFRTIVGTKIDDSSVNYDGKMEDSILNFDEIMESLMVLKYHDFDVKRSLPKRDDETKEWASARS